MKFVFVCPEKQKVFESASFEIINNKGIALDVKGNKFLDAKVALIKPCPFCGKKHVYHSSELWRLVFVNNGVTLTIDGSDVLNDLKEFENRGLKILVCGTCLTRFNLLETKKVRKTTNMLDMVTAMQLADKVISI